MGELLNILRLKNSYVGLLVSHLTFLSCARNITFYGEIEVEV
jgi:hypothetical protein